MSKRSYWLVKSEPAVYPYSQLASEKRTWWTGIRSYEARNNLRAMKKGDLALYYHSTGGKELVGVARVTQVAGPDPTAPGEDWAAVELEAVTALAQPVSLAEVKARKSLAKMQLVTRSRLSVCPVTDAEFETVLKMSGTVLKAR